MSFQLVIASGKEAGREFVFDQDSVLIGRTEECDVILYEAGVSRKHARLIEQGDSVVIEDLNSSNGTKVNGEAVQRQALKDGDTIGLGTIAFTFTYVHAQEGDGATGEVPLEDGGLHTRVVKASELKRSRNKGVAGVPENVQRGDLAQLGGRETKMMEAVDDPPPLSPAAGAYSRRKSTEGARPERPKQVVEKVLESALDVKLNDIELSAAEKARIRRKKGEQLGRVEIFWTQASKPVRIAVAVLALLFVAAMVAVVNGLLQQGETVNKPREATALTADPVEHSFGLGDGVMFEHANSVSFEFEPKAPVQVMVVLHYQSKDIAPGEVMVSVNGVEVGPLDADALAADEVSHDLLIPSTVLKRNEVNTLTFDNLKNPPWSDTWRVWNLSVEVAVLPETDAEGLKTDALSKFHRAELKLTQAGIGAANLWHAYKDFREAWLTLESLPAEQRGATYDLARRNMVETRSKLDLQCNKLLLEARQRFELKQYDKAHAALDHVKDYFPTRSGHPCQFRAETARQEYER
ncbi:MAG: FHA domain-containing protein [Archangium sp.]|nr:FHA domain-containing protein [Archangium sp.]